MARQIEYLVYRKGSNAYNQPGTTGWVPIAIVRAPNYREAKQISWHGQKPTVHGCPSLAAEVLVNCGNLHVCSNQVVRAVPVSRAPKRDLASLREAALHA